MNEWFAVRFSYGVVIDDALLDVVYAVLVLIRMIIILIRWRFNDDY